MTDGLDSNIIKNFEDFSLVNERLEKHFDGKLNII